MPVPALAIHNWSISKYDLQEPNNAHTAEDIDTLTMCVRPRKEIHIYAQQIGEWDKEGRPEQIMKLVPWQLTNRRPKNRSRKRGMT